ncbi:helix-turn-helix domain-containing protein [Streptomyces roseoverticillatus]|uniref:helix-turn-helix domain-containing protein n=1 Tax=Streptomyces roseoverticillatus TaxID=66429 RepID=UPI001F33BBEF|nr:helix-turn-helix transcriptional regulator [Streptomyces roseoverticillatus]MCF3103940.1 helix-turn-helix domain-containing protein [Streptomyces roseoverticillatus]
MARPEKPVDPAAPYAAFALQLRKLRADGGSPTYASLARRTGYSVSALSQAAAGRKLPGLDLTLAFAKACGGDGARWEKLWESARCQSNACGVTGLPPETRVQPAEPPVPASAETVRDFVTCLRELKAWAGDPSLSRIERASGGELRRSTLGDALNPARASLPSLSITVVLIATLLNLARIQGRVSDDAQVLEQWMTHWLRLMNKPRQTPPTIFRAAHPPAHSLRIARTRRTVLPAPTPEHGDIATLKTAIASHKARLAELEAQLRKAEAARELRLLDRRSA